MTEVTRLLDQIQQGDPSAAAELLPLVYDELRKLASVRLIRESPGQTLQATALVHEAYLRLVAKPKLEAEGALPRPDHGDWNSRGHFFAAAAEAMRRILVESARRKACVKHGGAFQRVDIDPGEFVAADISDHLLSLDEALDRLAESDQQAAKLVKLRYFAGLTIPQAAEVLGISPRKASSVWSFARAWLRREIEASR